MFKHIATRQQAYEMLKDMKVPELKEIAKANRIFVRNANKKQLIEKIINGTVGIRLKSEAIKDLTL